ncbi:MAG: DUF6470 family protein [Clostridiales bacterium]|nr:DUF6470 family protein [Clostridiales bacterium]
MITQLLQITTKPIEYELKIERARLEYSQDFLPKAKVNTEPAKLEVKTQNAKVVMNTYEARKSLGQASSADNARTQSDKGKESIGKTTRMYVDIGNEMTRIDEGITIADIFAQKVMGDQPVLYTAFLPSTGAQITWIPYDVDTRFTDGGVSYDWEIMRNIMNYVPGSVRMTILQLPTVEVEYIGDHMYFPPSADPDYVGPEE